MVLVTLCATWKRPFCSTKVSTLAPGWFTPWSVNTPEAITTGVAVAVAAMDWKCSVPDTADARALAAVSPVTASDAAATSAPAAPRSLLFSLRSITPPRELAKPLVGFAEWAQRRQTAQLPTVHLPGAGARARYTRPKTRENLQSPAASAARGWR